MYFLLLVFGRAGVVVVVAAGHRDRLGKGGSLLRLAAEKSSPGNGEGFLLGVGREWPLGIRARLTWFESQLGH